MRLPRGKKKKMNTAQAELKKSLDTGSWGTSCLSPGFEKSIASIEAGADLATAKGRDLLEEMAASVEARVNVTRQEFENASASGAEG
jgi:hypothetical protein